MSGKFAIREQRFEYGEYLEVNIYPVFRTPRQTKRSITRKPSREVQQVLNRRNRSCEVNRVICANFTNEDLYITVTWKGDPPTEAEFRRELENALKRMGRALAKKGKKLKWVKTVEPGKKSGRPHAHLVITGGLAPQEIQQLWGKGYVDCKPLMFDKNGVTGLARYFTKLSRNEAGDGKKKKSWSCSRNCVRPQPKTNDYKYSKKRAREIAQEQDNCRVLDKLYPEYICDSCEEFYSDDTGFFYLHLRFYRKGAKFDL